MVPLFEFEPERGGVLDTILTDLCPQAGPDIFDTGGGLFLGKGPEILVDGRKVFSGIPISMNRWPEVSFTIGTWQVHYFCEFDGPRHRQVLVGITDE